MQLQAIFFDLYETLITEFDPKWKPSASIADVLGIDPKRFKQEWRARQPLRLTGVYPDFSSVIQDICISLDHPIADEVMYALETQRIENKRIPFSRIDQAILNGLKEIQREGCKLGVMSNCAREEVMAWKESLLAPFFDDAVFSYEVGCAKPDRRIYQLACKRLHITPEETIFVGDGGHNELEGAINAGMGAYQATWFLDKWPISKHSHNTKVAPYRVVHTFDELISFITT